MTSRHRQRHAWINYLCGMYRLRTLSKDCIIPTRTPGEEAFLPCDATQSTVMSQFIVCLSVCPSVTLRYVFMDDMA